MELGEIRLLQIRVTQERHFVAVLLCQKRGFIISRVHGHLMNGLLKAGIARAEPQKGLEKPGAACTEQRMQKDGISCGIDASRAHRDSTVSFAGILIMPDLTKVR